MTDFLDYTSFVTGYGKGGSKPGILDVSITDVYTAKNYVEDEMKKHGRSLYSEIPKFDKYYREAKSTITSGVEKRKDMPVFDTLEVKKLQHALVNGKIDVSKPYSPTTNPNDLFPKGLVGEKAADFLERGLNDGNKTDDVIKVRHQKIEIKDLIPIQGQVYLDKTMRHLSEDGAKECERWVKNTLFVISSDNFIVDGHHRYLTAMLIDPTMKVSCLVIDLPIKKLLELSVAFTDAIGKKRNESLEFTKFHSFNEFQTLNEGRYDKLTGEIAEEVWKIIHTTRKIYEIKRKSNSFKKEFPEYDGGQKTGMLFDMTITVSRNTHEKIACHVDGFAVPDEELVNELQIFVNIHPAAEPKIYSYLNALIQDTIRHELEHLTQGGDNVREHKPKPSTDAMRKATEIPEKEWKYFLLRDEIPAMVQGLYRRAKILKRPLDTVMMEYLNYFKSVGELDDSHISKIMKEWLEFAHKNLPQAKYSK